MNTENKPNPANNTPEFFIKQRKAKREQLRKSTDQTQKNRLKKEIKQSQIEELKQRQIELQKERQDLKEYAYKWIGELDKLFQKIGITRSSRELCERYGKSPCYFPSMKKNNNFPSLDTINLIIYDLENLEQNLDLILPKEENKKLVKAMLQILLSKFRKLQIRVLPNF